MSIEVEPLGPDTVAALKAAGHRVFRSDDEWRVQVSAPAYGSNSLRAQAHVLVADTLADFSLAPTTQPPTYSLRDPEGDPDARPDLLLRENERAYDPDPLARPRRKWWQRAMELGLGERKGD